jgi:ankyrin repeat protein
VTSLIDLVKDGDVAAVENALAAGAGIEQKDEKGWTPLLWACRTSNEKVAAALIARGADIHAALPHGVQPLGIAAGARGAGAPAIVRQLLDAGADVDHRDSSGFTPLAGVVSSFWSAKGKEIAISLAVIDLLLARGANPKTKNALGEGPVEWAERSGNDELQRRFAPQANDGKSNWWSRLFKR